jgi:two-component system, chemotaxis family, sensor kinase CheA
MDDLLKEFLQESAENLNRVDNDLLVLEKNPQSPETIDSIFRAIHTVKGTCGFLSFSKLEKVAHVGENLLSKLREKKILVTTEIISALLCLVDAIREIIAHIEQTEAEGDGDYSTLIALINGLIHGEVLAVHPKVSIAPAEAPTNPQPASDNIYRETGPIPTPIQPLAQTEEAVLGTSAIGETAVRVDISLLDKLMDLVGELVLARNQIMQFSQWNDDPIYQGTFQRLNAITTDLQGSIMKTRMQPIGNVWSRFPRLVRDLSMACGKQVELFMEGRETELDRTLLEAIKDPLTHIVRNAIDHGIEKPERRVAKGKPATGMFVLKAYHEGGQVTIAITDDGGGIDPERVKQKAVEKGLITHEQASRMEDQTAVQLIFLPGFSTAEAVTNISGRGVGMDVVKTNIEKVGGTIDVQSRLGTGTSMKIKIPLTLAIVPALIVGCGGDRYAIPQVNLLELVRLEGEQIKQQIETVHHTPVFRLRGRLLPLIYLNEVLQVEDTDQEVAPEEKVRTIIVLQADDEQFGLVVELVNDTEEIVVKPLSMHLKGLAIFAGATILGDGKVALILDAFGMAQHIGMISDEPAAEKDFLLGDKNEPTSAGNNAEQNSLLVFSLGNEQRMAVALNCVARLEEIKRSSIERAVGKTVIQYRGSIMPLIYVPEAILGAPPLGSGGPEKLHVVVYNQGGKLVGLVVDDILDIVDDEVEVQLRVNQDGQPMSEDGIMGSAVIQGQITDILDVPAIMQKMRMVFFQGASQTTAMLN